MELVVSQAIEEMARCFKRVNPMESVAIEEAEGRVLAEAVTAREPMPPYDRVGVDGYAFRFADLKKPLKVIETVTAGTLPEKCVGTGECIRVMTGSLLPGGADAVVKQEKTQFLDDGRIQIQSEAFCGCHIAYKGSELSEGETVLEAGQRLQRSQLPLLASLGYGEVKVSSRPRVCILATGNEVVDVHETPGAAQVRNANSMPLMVSVRKAGGLPRYGGIVPDKPGALKRALDEALADSDVLLMTGGSFGGDHDYVHEVLRDEGFMLAEDDALGRSTRHLTFAFKDDRSVLGLPGFPVSSFVFFEILIKPMLLALQGHFYQPIRLNLKLAQPWIRRRGGRDDWSPVRITADRRVERLAYRGSGHIHALAQAQGLARLPANVTSLEAGDTIEVQLFD